MEPSLLDTAKLFLKRQMMKKYLYAVGETRADARRTSALFGHLAFDELGAERMR
jgi:hypothetical protein